MPKNILKYLLLLLIGLSSQITFSQENGMELLKKADSLILTDKSTSIDLIMKVRKQANELGDKKLVAESFLTKGNLYYDHDNFDLALIEFENALLIFKELQDTSGLEKVLNNLGATSTLKGDYINSLEYYLTGYSYLKNATGLSGEEKNVERIKNYLYILNNLGKTYFEMNDFKLAKNYFEKVVEGAGKIDDEYTLHRSLQDLAMTHMEMGENEDAKKRMLHSIRVEKGMKTGVKNLSLKYALLSKLHFKLGERVEAKYQLENAVMTFSDSNMIRWDQVNLLNVLGDLFIEINDFDSAIKRASKALKMANELSIRTEQIHAHLLLSQAYAGKSMFQKAYKHEQLLRILSLKSDETISSLEIARVEMRLNYEKKALIDSIQSIEIKNLKEKELIEVNAKNRNRMWVIVSLSIGMVILLVLILLLIGYNKRKAKINALLKKSLGEKEVLLKEVHHRVKNNFQVISSLLNLQLSTPKSNVEDALRIAQNRIQSMALVHRKLYGSDDFEAIEMQGYIKELVDSIVLTNQISSNFKVEINAEDKFLELDKAIPLGLILNEIITNFFKYVSGSVDSPQLEIKIDEVDSNIQVFIKDNGPGLPDDLDLENLSSLGLELVSILSEQINADLQIKNNFGTQIHLLIPKK